MDSSSSSELTPKTEVDTEGDTKRVQWTSENTAKLIEAFEKECRELWDTKHIANKDKSVRQAKLEYLATVFNTNSEEISRKLHNLRTQFNNELRKIKRRAAGGEASSSSAVTSGWEYFESLLFLLREPLVDTVESMDAVSLALAEFQADEEIEFEAAAARSRLYPQPSLSTRKPTMRVAASAPNPLPASANPMLWPDEPRLYPNNIPDECQIFGDFVASELRLLRNLDNRSRLKRIIQKAILQVAEEDDAHVLALRRSRLHSAMSTDPLN
ncbi:uncharacterized protein LOC112055987 [Bicyclus anynana]|uniref:Uncharacterized protein LOC112055987 n=1 Tax=Bicyclus anynana TaxID=110368 RepID=A0A6J1P234_BICAN|nr:uncharacterized protein LOC112055987 [Bicyclus anynana]